MRQWDDFFTVVSLVKQSLEKAFPPPAILTKPAIFECVVHNLADRYVLVRKIQTLIDKLIGASEIRNGYGRHIYLYDDLAERAKKQQLWLKGLFVFELLFHTATSLSKFAM